MASLVNVTKDNAVDPPVLAVFSAGTPTAVADSDSFSFQYFSHPRKPAEGVVFGEASQTHYLGTNAPSASLVKNRNNYAVGVFRSGRDTVRIVPAHGLFVMREANNADAGGIDALTIKGGSYDDIRTQLTERFGSRKRRRELRSEQANAFDINSDRAASLAAQMALDSVADLAASSGPTGGIHSGRLDKLPAFDADTSSPEKIYSFSALLPEDAWGELDSRAILKPSESPEELRAIYPRFVLMHMKRAQETYRVDKEAARSLARQLAHLTYLLRLCRAPSKVRAKEVETYTLAPPAVAGEIKRLYFDAAGGRLTSELRARLLCHVAVLSLICSPACALDGASIEALAGDLQELVSKLLPYFGEVGCKNPTRTRAALTAPLQLPELNGGGGGGKRGRR